MDAFGSRVPKILKSSGLRSGSIVSSDIFVWSFDFIGAMQKLSETSLQVWFATCFLCSLLKLTKTKTVEYSFINFIALRQYSS